MLFLVEKRAWQHLVDGAIYFRYVMIHVIYSDTNPFQKMILRRYTHKFSNSCREKQHQLLEE